MAAVALSTVFTHSVHAQTFTWDGDTTTAGAQDGNGTWDAGITANWYNGTNNVVWPNGTQTAAFGTGNPTNPVTPYIVTVSGTVNAGGITFNQGGYTLQGGTINLNPGATTTPFVFRTNGGTSTIGTATTNTALTSAGGQLITKTGAGTLVIGGNGGGGAANTPALYTVTGGTFSSSTGLFDSVLSMVAGNRLGNGNANAAAAATNPQVTLDAGTIQFTQTTVNGNNLADSRGVRVTANGGAINDAGGTGVGTAIPSAIVNNAGTNTSLYLSTVSGTTQYQGVISGGGSLTGSGAGNVNLQAANTYTGATVVNSGVVSTGNLQANGTASGLGQGTAVTLNGGTLRYTGAGTGNANGGGFNRTITVGANGGTFDSAGTSFLAYSGSFAGSGTLTLSGGNQFLYNGTSAGNFTGNIIIGNGTAGNGFVQYRSGNANAFGSGTITINAGGTLSADGGTTTPSALSNAFTLNGGSLVTQAPNMTYSGAISLTATSTVGHISNGTGTVTLSNAISSTGTFGLNIVGGTTVTLSGASNYTGATTVSAATVLSLDNNNSTTARVGNSSGIVASAGTTTGATIQLTQSGTTASTDRIGDAVPVTLAAGTAAGRGGIFNTGGLTEGPAGGAAGSAAAMGALTLQANSTINFTAGGSSLLFSSLVYMAGDAVRILNFTGAVGADDGTAGNNRLLFTTDPSLTASQLASIQFYSDAGTTAIGSGATEIGFNGYFELVPTPVPEPATWMVGAFLVGTVGVLRRRQIVKLLS